LQLFHPESQTIFHRVRSGRINQQYQVESCFQPVPQQPVRFPADPPGPVPVYRIPELPGEGNNHPVAGQPVFQYKQLGAQAGNSFSPVENGPDFIPSL
jgi:hypothetical protein